MSLLPLFFFNEEEKGERLQKTASNLGWSKRPSVIGPVFGSSCQAASLIIRGPNILYTLVISAPRTPALLPAFPRPPC